MALGSFAPYIGLLSNLSTIVVAGERIECSNEMPFRALSLVSVFHESADIRAGEGNAEHAHLHDSRDGELHELVLGEVVS